MEKKVVRPNVRIKAADKKNAPTKEEKSLDYVQSSSFKKADNMENGFVKIAEPKNHNEKSSSSTQRKLEQDLENKEEKSFDNKVQGYQISLSPSLCITAFVTLLITMAFIFLFGFIIGKGMMPVQELAEPEKLQPQMQVADTSSVMPQEVLPKEDLQFMTTLKVEPAKKKEHDVDKHAMEQNLADAIGEKHDEIIPSSRIFDFNIRVAAFRQAEQADTLREKLEGAGYRTIRVVEKDSKGKNWYFVHVLMRGSELRLNQAREEFKKFAIRDSIIKEQKEVK